jgi:cytochrome c oxidase subunit 2
MSGSPRSRPSQTAIFAIAIGLALIIVSAIVVAVGFNLVAAGDNLLKSFYPPVAVTEQGAKIRELYTIVFLIAVAIFIVVEGLIIWSVIRYRRKPGDDILPAQTHGNNIAEFVWTVVPTLIVIFMFVISWQTLNVVDNTSATPQTRIRAVAGQFQWQFDYLSDDGKTILYTQLLPTGEDGGMVVPAGRTTLLTLVSNDVIHAFYVPQFLFKRDVVPGRVNSFEFKVNESDAGQTFRGQCAELCGVGHSIMLFEVHALTGTEFDAWLKGKIDAASATPTPPPSPAPGASGEAGGPGPTLEIVAKNIAYEESALTAPANTPFKIDFDNQDAGTAHNVSIHTGSATGAEVFKGEIFAGPAKKLYDVPALAAGTYAFVCTVHPSMTGTLTVQ